MVLGPALLGWIEPDLPVQVMSAMGVAFLLFLAGMELDLRVLQGDPLRLRALGFLLSFALALAIELAFQQADLVLTPLLVAVALSATSVGIVGPVPHPARRRGGRQHVRLRGHPGAFIAGAVFAIVARRWEDVDTYRKKLNGLGFGFFVPVFFVFSGMRLEPGEVFGWFDPAGAPLAPAPLPSRDGRCRPAPGDESDVHRRRRDRKGGVGRDHGERWRRPCRRRAPLGDHPSTIRPAPA